MWRDDAYLLDILLAARRAIEFSQELDWPKFQHSDLHQSAIVRMIEIIGEAARKLSQETKDTLPEVPWTEIVGMRHRLVHDYLHVDMEKVWYTVQNDLPKLITIIGSRVPPDEE